MGRLKRYTLTSALMAAQVQGLMEIFDREWCHAYIWTPNGSALWTFRRDREYWKIAYEVCA